MASVAFDSVRSRFALRASLLGAAAGIASLQASLPGISGEEGLEAAIAAGTAALAYAGIGAAIPQVEPNIGRKLPE